MISMSKVKPAEPASVAALLLELRDVTLAYADAGRRVVATEEISLDVGESDRIVLLGQIGRAHV